MSANEGMVMASDEVFAPPRHSERSTKPGSATPDDRLYQVDWRLSTAFVN